MAEKEYIDRQSTVYALARLCKRVCQYSEKQRQFMCGACPLGDAFTVIEDDLPAADVRPVGLLEQVEWERDIALAQLAEIGKIFGEKMDDVRPVVLCRDCIFRSNEWTGCPKLNGTITGDEFFCKCGIKREES